MTPARLPPERGNGFTKMSRKQNTTESKPAPAPVKQSAEQAADAAAKALIRAHGYRETLVELALARCVGRAPVSVATAAQTVMDEIARVHGDSPFTLERIDDHIQYVRGQHKRHVLARPQTVEKADKIVGFTARNRNSTQAIAAAAADEQALASLGKAKAPAKRSRK